MKNLILLLCVMILPIQAKAGGEEGGWISGGGDPLRIYFEEGRIYADELLKQVDLAPGKIVSQDVADWFRANQAALAADLAKSEHAWHEDDQATCAFTEYRLEAPIKLSFDSCRSISSKEEAAKVLIHESVHHLGVADHTFADRVAVQVVASFEAKKLRGVAICPEKTPPLVRGMLGRWGMDPKLAKVIANRNEQPVFSEIQLEEDRSAVSIFDEFKQFHGGCALSAGYLSLTPAQSGRAKRVPYFIRRAGLKLFLITFRSEEDFTRRNLSARTIQLVKSDKRRRDKLIITSLKKDIGGGDRLNRNEKDFEIETFERGVDAPDLD